MLTSFDIFQSHDEIDPLVLLNMIFVGAEALATVFVLCEIGQRIGGACNEINDVFDRLNWYLFPIEVRETLPMVILYVQQPINFKFFGSFACSREQLKRVSMMYRSNGLNDINI